MIGSVGVVMAAASKTHGTPLPEWAGWIMLALIAALGIVLIAAIVTHDWRDKS